MKDLLFRFGITVGRRYTKKQKAWFLEEVALEADKQGWKTELLTHKTKISKSFHLAVGDLKNAQWVLIAAYDTPTKLILPNSIYYPFKAEKNLKTDSTNLLMQVFISFFAFTALYFLLKYAATQVLTIQIPIWIGSFIAFLILFKMLSGFTNRLNQNRNSASVAMMLDLLKEPSLKHKMALLFADKSVIGIEGYKELRDMDLISPYARTIILDCLAYGETLALACAEKDKANADLVIKNIKTDIYLKTYPEESIFNFAFSMFPSGMSLVSGERSDKDFIVRNTRSKKDYKVNQERLTDIRNGLLNTIKGGK